MRGILNHRRSQTSRETQKCLRVVIEPGLLTSEWCGPDLNVGLSPQELFTTVPVPLQLRSASQSPGGLGKTQIARLQPQN